jgi:hypothetical protein
LALKEDERDFDGADEWVRYSSRSQELSVLTINGRITSVTCQGRCSYGGRNLIGMTDASIRSLFQGELCDVDADPFGHSLEFDGLDLIVEFIDGEAMLVTVSGDPDLVD